MNYEARHDGWNGALRGTEFYDQRVQLRHRFFHRKKNGRTKDPNIRFLALLSTTISFNYFVILSALHRKMKRNGETYFVTIPNKQATDQTQSLREL